MHTYIKNQIILIDNNHTKFMLKNNSLSLSLLHHDAYLSCHKSKSIERYEEEGCSNAE